MPLASLASLGSLGAGLLQALLLLPGAGAPDAPPLFHVRAAVPEVRTLIADTMQRSVIVRELVARLSCSDIIVYVEMTASPQIPTARTKLVAAPTGTRFLRIALNTHSQGYFAPLLAHELQHAVEIAEHEEVRDEAAVRRLYRQIGYSTGEDAFETAAARQVEAHVREELRRKIGG